MVTSPPATLRSEQTDKEIRLFFAGYWVLQADVPQYGDWQRLIPEFCHTLTVDCRELKEWDSRFLVFLKTLGSYCAQHEVAFNQQGLPLGVRRLLALSSSPAQQQEAIPLDIHLKLLKAIGLGFLDFLEHIQDLLRFTGEITLGYTRLFQGRAQYLKSDFVTFFDDCGPKSLPIVSLISILVGIILSFVGAIQLQLFGAEIYIADLVGLGMTREMGAMMVAVIMAGRTGAAYAAQLGTMQVNEEIDALKTMGINPTDFLVLPRMSALILMMPLLTLWADFLGILGGFLVTCGTMDISAVEYYQQTVNALNLSHLSAGLLKSVVFGYLVAFAGCLKGMECGRSASAVGYAATSAVVTAIVFIVMSDAALTYLFTVIGF